MTRSHPLLLAVCLTALAQEPVDLHAQPLATRIFPRATSLLIQIEDAQAIRAACGQTGFGQLLQDPALRPLVQDLWSVAEDSLVEFESRLDTKLVDLVDIAQGEVAFAVVKRPRDRPGFLLLLESGDRPEIMRGLLERLQEMLLAQGTQFREEQISGSTVSVFRFGGGAEEDGGSRELIFCERDRHVLIATHADTIERSLTLWNGQGETKPLGEDETYKQAFQRLERTQRVEPHARFYVDPIALAYTVTGGNPAAQAALATIPLLGLKDVEALAGSLTINQNGFDWLLQAHLLIDGDRQGIPQMLSFDNHPSQPPTWVPDDVTKFSEFRFQPKTTLIAFRKLFDLFQGENATENAIRDNISQRIDVDFEKQIIPALTGQCVRMERLNAGVINPSSAFGLQFASAIQANDLLEKLATKFDLPEESIGGRKMFVLRRNRGGGASSEVQRSDGESASPGNRRRLFRRNTAALAVVGDYLLFADDRELLADLLDENRRASLSEHEGYRAVRAAMKGDLGLELSSYALWVDSVAEWQQRYALLNSPEVMARMRESAQSQPWAVAAMRSLDAHPLPAFEVIERYFAASGAALINEESGFQLTAFSLKSAE